MRDRGRQRVYFIKPVGMDGPVKIGCSRSPDGRRSVLATWSPFALEIIAEIDGDFQLERRFHARFVRLHQRREWFRMSPDIAETVAQINAGSFDVESLPEPSCVAHMLDGRKQGRPEAFRRQISYTSRAYHTKRRTGFKCPVQLRDLVKQGDAQRIAAVDAYLADPVKNGVSPFDQYAELARKYPDFDWAKVKERAQVQMAAAGLEWPEHESLAA